MLIETLASLATLDPPQAGGGGGFGGGGGGGGGDGEGIGYIVYLLIRFAIEYPLIGVPLLILVLILLAKGGRRGLWGHQERVIRRHGPQREARASARAAEALKRTDPDFSESRFLARVRIAFGKAQDGWCKQELEGLRSFVSDGVFERFSLQIEEQEQDGWRQGMEHTRLGSPMITHIESGRHFDTITVSVPFTADIHRLSLETGKKISGSSLPRDSFREHWSFVRRSGAKSFNGDGLIEGRCPNCGADLTMNQSAHCGTCECLARSGQFDWVLTEITQSSVWSVEHEADIPGFSGFLAVDPGFSVQLLEDRTSVAFWRMAAADRAGDVAPLSCMATEEFCTGYAQRLAPRQNGTRRYRTEAAVGSVRTLGLVLGEELDHALVLVVWDGVRATASPDGTRELERDRRRRETLFVLRRKHGQKTRLESTFTTAHCQTCGAHDAGGTQPTCPYCDAPRRGDSSTWLVHEILDRRSPEARVWLGEVTERADAVPEMLPVSVSSPTSADALLSWSAGLVLADGPASAAEEQALHTLAKRVGVPGHRVRTLLAGSDGPAPDFDPRDARHAPGWLGALFELALADGKVTRDERAFLKHAGESLGLTPKEVEGIRRRTRSELYRESR